MNKSYSPLRYPGGKGQLIDMISKLLIDQNMGSINYVEPFAGGSGLALSLLISGKVEKISINDYDKAIYAFWYGVLNCTTEFIKKIENVEVTIKERLKQKEIYFNEKDNLLDLGFSAFFLNRVNHSGIIKAGAIGGNHQKGNYKIDCRFKKNKLIEKIDVIASLREKISLTNMDATEFISNEIIKMDPFTTFIFFDPPYYTKGKNLYTNFYTHVDHQNLKRSISLLNSFKWIVTYDDCDEIKEMYSDINCKSYEINYCLMNKVKATELFYWNNVKI